MSVDSQVQLDVLQEFLVEAYEELNSVSEGLTQLEHDQCNRELLNQIYRSLHTIKGAASFLQFRGLEGVTHAIENVLDVIREKELSISGAVTDLLLKGIDYIGESLKTIESTGVDSGQVDQNLVDSLNQLSVDLEKGTPADNEGEAEAETEAAAATLEVASVGEPEAGVKEEPTPVPENLMAQPSEANVEGNSEPDIPVTEANPAEAKETAPSVVEKKEEVAAVAKVEKVSQVEEKMTVSAPSAEAKKPVIKGGEKSITDTVVKVNVNLLDKIMNVVGELVLNRNQIVQFSSAQELPELNRLANELNSITTELQSDIMTTRMQPIGSVLAKFERVIRDLGRETGKKISLRIEGRETELDRTILEAIRDPLTHLVRNAVDHGVEGPEQRVASGKPPEGHVTIKAYHEGGQVTIDLIDDGKGLSKEKVVAKAIEKGLINTEKAESLSDKQIFNLIFLPGFSTAEKVTNISGRGVGMDVVRTNVEKIGGQVEVTSVEGVGTTFKLRIPLTLAIIPAMIVESGDASFAIPQANLVELVRLEEDRVNEIEELNGSEFLRLRGNLVPIIRLGRSMNLESKEEQDRKVDKGLNVVVLNAESCQYGLIVEEIRDTQEIVVKPLSKLLKELSIFAGATIMGDGSVALIIDVMGFAQFSRLGMERGKEIKAESLGTNEDSQDVILFSLESDSLFGVPLCLVNRLEEFDADQVEMVGNQEVIKYRDQVMPILDLNRVLGLEAPKDVESISILVIYMKHCYFGLRVNEVIDIRTIHSSVQGGITDQTGIMGTVFVEDRTVTMLDVYDILDEPLQAIKKTSGTPMEVNQAKRKILLVDDSPFFRKVGTEALEDSGFEVSLAANGELAYQLLQKQEFDLVVSDIEMPVMDGLELARQIRGDEKLQSIPLIAVTTKYDSSDVTAGKEAGYQIYLEKFRKVEIVEAIHQLLT